VTRVISEKLAVGKTWTASATGVGGIEVKRGADIPQATLTMEKNNIIERKMREFRVLYGMLITLSMKKWLMTHG